MPGVRIVEEPDVDLWFAPDQCVDPSVAARALEGAGFYGLGHAFDPEPWRMLSGLGGPRSHETGKKPKDWKRAPFTPTKSILHLPPEVEDVPPMEELQRAEAMGRKAAWREGLPAYLQFAPDEIISDIEKNVLFLSVNSKTGFSFNIRIAGYHGLLGETWSVGPEGKIVEEERRLHETIPGTCAPTAWCYAHCYAKKGHYVTWEQEHWYDLSVQQARYLQNLLVCHQLEHADQDEVDAAADLLYDALVAEYQKPESEVFEDAPLNLRWNGGGDFSGGSARIVNSILKRHPDCIIWGFTRKPTTADLLRPHHSLRMNVSLDPTTPPYGPSGFKLDDLVDAACKLRGNLVYATDVVQDQHIEELRPIIQRLCRGMTGIATVFGYHCGSKHTTIADRQECSATNPRMYGWCQKCRWCMMSAEEKMAEDVTTPNQAYFRHGGAPDVERINKENRDREKHGIPAVDPISEDEVWGV